MSILGFSFSGSEVYLAHFIKKEEWQLSTEKFVLTDDEGRSLRELYNYVELYLNSNSTIDMIVMEIATSGLHMPSLARVKAEGIIDMLLADKELSKIMCKIKTQKRRKHYAELPENPEWKRFRSIKYFAKTEQFVAYLILEGHI